MALSNISKEHSNKLLCSINSKELQTYSNVQKIRTNNVAYAKLKMLAKQINALQQEAQNVISETLKIQDLNNIKYSFKKYPGTTYYLYQKNIDYDIKDNIDDYNNDYNDDNNDNNIEDNKNYLDSFTDKDDNKYFSLLSPNEWDYSKENKFIGQYYYDYDLTLNKV